MDNQEQSVTSTDVKDWLMKHTFEAIMNHGNPLDVTHGNYMVVFPFETKKKQEGLYYFARVPKMCPDVVIVSELFPFRYVRHGVVEEGIDLFTKELENQGFTKEYGDHVPTNGSTTFDYVVVTLPAAPVVKKESDS